MKQVLRLTLKKQWFDMISSGEKKEEYREVKPYWIRRLMAKGFPPKLRHFDYIIFKNGYAKSSPEMMVECKGIEIGYGNPLWGAKPNVNYFRIMLGKIFKNTNG